MKFLAKNRPSLLSYILVVTLLAVVFAFVRDSAFADLCHEMSAEKDAAYNRKPTSEPRIAQSILNEYGFQMDISNANEIYHNVYVSGEGKTNSPASMLLDPGVCRLIYSNSRLSHWLLSFSNKQNIQALKVYTIAHEASHCLFVSSDYRVRDSTGALTGDLRSLPISYRTKLKFLNELQSTERDKQILIYREALGDVFAIGYLYAVSVENRESAIAQILEHRKTESDGIHYTGCWIQHALDKHTYPTRVIDIRAWAIDVVESADCDTKTQVEKSQALSQVIL